MHTGKLAAAALLPFLAACGDTTGPEAQGAVDVRFQAVTASSISLPAVQATGPITLTGSNGTLIINDISLIVSEIELEGATGECLNSGDDDCEEIERGPVLIHLLDGTADATVNALVPAGSYSELEFEVEALDADDDDDTAERQAKQAILTEIRQRYNAFPADASMVVSGTFNGQAFTVYFDAEIEIEQEFETLFRVPEDGSLLVHLDPSLWFRSGTQVMNLAAMNGQTIEFDAEFENGVVEVEFDD